MGRTIKCAEVTTLGRRMLQCGFNITIMYPKDAGGMSSSLDPVVMILVYTVCLDMSVLKYRIVMVKHVMLT